MKKSRDLVLKSDLAQRKALLENEGKMMGVAMLSLFIQRI
jgi:hypothetical protein